MDRPAPHSGSENGGKAVLGLDFGSESVRAILVDCSNGAVLASAAAAYLHGGFGPVITTPEPDSARQAPAAYLDAMISAVRETLAQATAEDASRIAAIGIATTGSTVLPLDGLGQPLASSEGFWHEPAALAWMWKDHTAHREAEEINARIAGSGLPYLDASGGLYSSEWFWAKLLKCARSSPHVMREAATWIELQDWVPAVLCELADVSAIPRGICAAGHKGMYAERWGGWPDGAFLGSLDPELARIGATLPKRAHRAGETAGALSPQWAATLELPPGIPVSAGLLDAHAGAVGAGVGPGRLVRIVGTSSCDIAVGQPDGGFASEGLAGVVPDSVLPGFTGIEAGQAAVGDLFAWGSELLGQSSDKSALHELDRLAAELAPGASGLVALDWNNGSRSPLMDSRLTGLLVGQTLETNRVEIYRALVEATAFGARFILDQLSQEGVEIGEIIACGGVASKSATWRRVHADILGLPISIAGEGRASAIGAAIFGAVAGGIFANAEQAQACMAEAPGEPTQPDPSAHEIYDELFAIYRALFAAFGTGSTQGLKHIMPRLRELRHAAASRSNLAEMETNDG